jgi:hypothetical protein
MGAISDVLAQTPRDRAVMERTLTDGYAHVLSLEAERWRAQKQLRSLAAAAERGDLAQKTKELADLARRIEWHDDTLARMRDLLGRLRSEYGETPEPSAPRRR